MNMAVGLILPPTFPRQARSECPRSKVVGVGQMVFSFSCRRDSFKYCEYHTRLFAVSVAVAAFYSTVATNCIYQWQARVPYIASPADK